MARKCASCSLESDYEELFHRTKKGNHYCPVCWEKRAQTTARDTWISLLFIAAVGSMGFVFPQFPLSWSFTNFALLYGWMIVLIVPHEFGHAVAGWGVGFRIFAVCFGIGKRLGSFKIRGVKFEMRRFPFGGVTIEGFRDVNRIRRRLFLFTLAGPAVHILFISLVLAFIPLAHLYPVDRPPSPGYGAFANELPNRLLPAATFVLANAIMLIACLWPHRTTYMGMPVESDGLSLIKIPFHPEQVIQENHVGSFAWEALSFFEDKSYSEGMEWCRKGLAIYLENATLRYLLGLAHLNRKDFVKAREIGVDLIAEPELNLQIRMALYDVISLANILIAESIPDVDSNRSPKLPLSSDLVRQALGSSREALEIAPWSPEFRATRGAVLIEAGEVEEGLTLLRGVVPGFATENKSFYMCYIALGEYRSGRTEEANQSLALARTLDSDCFVLDVVAREFAEGRLNIPRLAVLEADSVVFADAIKQRMDHGTEANHATDSNFRRSRLRSAGRWIAQAFLGAFIVVALIGVGAFFWHSRGLTGQDLAIREIKDAGGTVEVDQSAPDNPVVSVDFDRLKKTGFMSFDSLGDDGLANVRPHLESLPKLRYLRIPSMAMISDRGLVQLEGLTQLETMDLYSHWIYGSTITEAGVDRLRKKLPHVHINYSDSGPPRDFGMRPGR